jgi:hypothetical protein
MYEAYNSDEDENYTPDRAGTEGDLKSAQQDLSAKKCDNSEALGDSVRSEDQESTLQAVWSEGNREEFEFIWRHLGSWEVFETWEEEPGDDSTNLDRRKYAASLMIEIDSTTRNSIERVFRWGLTLNTR